MRNLTVGLVTLLLLAGLVAFKPDLVAPEVRGLVGGGPTRVERAPEVTGNGSYRFMQHQPGNPNAPVTYDPCRPIRVQINPDGVQDERAARKLVLAAMAEVSAATGLRLEDAGTTTDRPRWRAGNRPVLSQPGPVLVAFATSDEVSVLEGEVAGVGGSTSVRSNGHATYVTGQVTLDSGTIDGLLDRRGGVESAKAIVLHELGHLVGLAHVADEAELMNARNGGRVDFGPGDLRGLALLGNGRCG